VTAREKVGDPAAIGQKLTHALVYSRRTVSALLQDMTETINAGILPENEAEAGAGAVKSQSALTMFRDGSWQDDGSVGCAAAWRNANTARSS